MPTSVDVSSNRSIMFSTLIRCVKLIRMSRVKDYPLQRSVNFAQVTFDRHQSNGHLLCLPRTKNCEDYAANNGYILYWCYLLSVSLLTVMYYPSSHPYINCIGLKIFSFIIYSLRLTAIWAERVALTNMIHSILHCVLTFRNLLKMRHLYSCHQGIPSWL